MNPLEGQRLKKFLKIKEQEISNLRRKLQKAQSLLAKTEASTIDRLLRERQPGKPLGRMQANFVLMEMATHIDIIFKNGYVCDSGDPTENEKAIRELNNFVNRILYVKKD